MREWGREGEKHNADNWLNPFEPQLCHHGSEKKEIETETKYDLTLSAYWAEFLLHFNRNAFAFSLMRVGVLIWWTLSQTPELKETPELSVN